MYPRFILLVAAIGVALPSFSQPPSFYNLKKVRVELMDGTVMRGSILDLTSDSIVVRIRGRSTTDAWVNGNKVTFRLRGVPKEYKATVEATTPTTVSVRLTTKQDEVSIVNRNQIESVTLDEAVYFPKDKGKLKIATHRSQVKSVHLHKKGSGLVGGLLGSVVAFIGLGVAINNHHATTFFDVGPTGAEPLLLLPVAGVVIGTIGTTHRIDGEGIKFQAFTDKVLKKGNKKRGEKPPL